ncbi:hypothetical protein [Chryseolinea lacunae]|uniref:Late embryogenesis abundant protein LEA-2 subgroup domain-containing protein n=1 Tax=Chryseolinea lacunae TaxID=2801331 RepID=A0ABS1KZ49_9BACT|nr:hypothetical protein [Chryseolinea lacunae]MBL0744664.1 hypothetical protein [Chryseolinea lacunae]
MRIERIKTSRRYFLHPLKTFQGKDNTLKMSDFLSLFISIAAFGFSAYTFLDTYVLARHELKATMVSIDTKGDSLICTILLINPGKSYETLYSGRFIFSDNLNKGGGLLSHEKIGPIVIPPAQAVVTKLKTTMPDINAMKEDGTLSRTATRVHMGVLFDAIDAEGKLPEGGTIYRFTQLEFDAAGKHVGSAPMNNDHSSLIDLL